MWGGQDEGAPLYSSTLLDALELLLGEEVGDLGLGALGLDCNGSLDAYYSRLYWIENGNARDLEVYKVGPTMASTESLVLSSRPSIILSVVAMTGLALLGVGKNIAPDVLLVYHHAVHDSGADHFSPPADGSSHLGLGAYADWNLGLALAEADLVQVVGCAANVFPISTLSQRLFSSA